MCEADGQDEAIVKLEGGRCVKERSGTSRSDTLSSFTPVGAPDGLSRSRAQGPSDCDSPSFSKVRFRIYFVLGQVISM